MKSIDAHLSRKKQKKMRKLPIGPLRYEKFFIRFFRSSVVQNGRFQKKLEKFFFRAERSLSVIFSKIFLVHDNKWKILR